MFFVYIGQTLDVLQCGSLSYILQALIFAHYSQTTTERKGRFNFNNFDLKYKLFPFLHYTRKFSIL